MDATGQLDCGPGRDEDRAEARPLIFLTRGLELRVGEVLRFSRIAEGLRLPLLLRRVSHRSRGVLSSDHKMDMKGRWVLGIPPPPL